MIWEKNDKNEHIEKNRPRCCYIFHMPSSTGTSVKNNQKTKRNKWDCSSQMNLKPLNSLATY
jgi:hypothetical protein